MRPTRAATSQYALFVSHTHVRKFAFVGVCVCASMWLCVRGSEKLKTNLALAPLCIVSGGCTKWNCGVREKRTLPIGRKELYSQCFQGEIDIWAEWSSRSVFGASIRNNVWQSSSVRWCGKVERFYRSQRVVLLSSDYWFSKCSVVRVCVRVWC